MAAELSLDENINEAALRKINRAPKLVERLHLSSVKLAHQNEY